MNKRVLFVIMVILAGLGAWLLMAGASGGSKRIALSFDDVPRGRGAWLAPDDRTQLLIKGLRDSGVRQAAFFVVPGQLDSDDGTGGEARLAAYAKAGHVIANHSFSHGRLSAEPAEAYLADIDRADAWLQGRAGLRRWYRFPFLDEGQAAKDKRDAVRAGLAKRNLANGYVTIDGTDWRLEALTINAVKSGQSLDRAALRQLYIETHVGAANFYNELAMQVLGRQPAHVLLLHETDIAALFLPDLIKALRDDGWTIITADEAYADPIAAKAAIVDVPSAQGTLIEALAWEKGLPAPRWYEPAADAALTRLFMQNVLKEQP